MQVIFDSQDSIMSFGYSVGDVITGANLTYQVIRIMADSKGASREYVEAMSELSAMQQAFLQISHLKSHKLLPAATVNAASHIVMSSMDTIAAFLERSKHYRALLDDPKAPTFQSSWCKVGWTLYKAQELRALRDTLHGKLTSVQLLLSSASQSVNNPLVISDTELIVLTHNLHSCIPLVEYQVDDKSPLVEQQPKTLSTATTIVEVTNDPPISKATEQNGSSKPSDGHQVAPGNPSSPTAVNEPVESALVEVARSPLALVSTQVPPATPEASVQDPDGFISLKDAVGRNFKFPWSKCSRWEVRLY